MTLQASPAAIAAGSSSTLTVSATNSTSVIVTGSDGSSYTMSSSGGTHSVSPKTTTTYTATASNNAGSATATATVSVSGSTSGNVTVTLAASPSTITSGNSSTLTVAATNATSVVVTGSDNSSYTLSPSGGTQSVSPTATTTYTATASNGSATATATATVTVSPPANVTVSIVADPTTITAGNSSTLTVSATNATSVTLTGSDSSSYSMQPTGGTQAVSPTSTTTYTATATGSSGSISATATVTVEPVGNINAIDHVIFMLQENRTFDTYFGMLNPYRQANGWTTGADGNTYAVDGIDDKLSKITNTNDAGTTYSLFKFTSSCIDDDTSAWLESYGDVNTYNFAADRPIQMGGFVHVAENFAESCSYNGGCSGNYTDLAGQRAMGYYDQGFLNYYYYMASQFALSDRWFSPVSSKTVDNRIAVITGGTTQGLTKDPGSNDHLPQLDINNIYQELDQANVSWKIYYTVNQANCLDEDDCPEGSKSSNLPATDFTYLTYSEKYLYANPSGAACVAPTQPSSVVGDSSNSFCIDPTHIAPLSQYYTDLTNGTLPSYAFIEAGFGNNDEHPGSGQEILAGQLQVSKIVGALMQSSSWKDSVFFLAYDEGGGPYDHVPPVPGHSNDNTDAMVGGEASSSIPDISTIAVNPDTYNPCVPSGGTATLHCDLSSTDPGAQPTDAPAVSGFAAQLGFRVPDIVISPFSRAHYVSHIPMDHTAIIKFVENRFIGSSAHLTPRDAAQPNLLDFFDFTGIPWATPPTPPTPASDSSLGYNSCTPTNFAPQ
ncbi:MAG TPA: alkaline phosphatase family protein [Acidobacteriaceae bacterium]|nr:alkaline phosphatase family protein [Acidobacteriaceae bacterium]